MILNEVNEVVRCLVVNKLGLNYGCEVKKWDEIVGWFGSVDVVIEED